MAQRVGGCDGAAPVLDHESDVAQIEAFDEPCEILDMGLERVGTIARRFTLSKAHMVRHDDPMRLRQRRDEATGEIAPGWFAMQTKDGLAASLPRVMHAKTLSVQEVQRQK